MRPDVNAKINFDVQSLNILCRFHPTIAKALINLLNNTADAKQDHLRIDITEKNSELTWIVLDQEPGILADINRYLGKKSYRVGENSEDTAGK